jgi:tetratricopeptide (TPR) repeat protein
MAQIPSKVGKYLYYIVIRDRNTANTNQNVDSGNDNGNTNTNGDDNSSDYKAELANAKSLFQNKDYAKAASICESIIKKHPNDASIHFLLGASRQKMLRNQEALVSYQQAVALDPTMDKAWQQIGFIYRDRMDYQNAENAFIQATKIDSGSGASWQGLADTYIIMQDSEKALAAYEKLLTIEPGNVTAHYNLGSIYLGKKDYASVKRAFLDTIGINPNFVEAHNNLGLDYTFAVQNNGELLTIGKAYSGITDVELQQLSTLFHEISLGSCGYYHPVKPQVVFEVTFDRINRSNRHSSGFALRFPRIKRIRWDKKPQDIDTLETVESLFTAHFST